MRSPYLKSLLIATLTILSACSTSMNYQTFRRNQPRSILVLPPVNSTNTLHATEIYLASVAYPLGEAGYYVFPPLTTFKYFREQGIPTGSEAREIPHKKLREIFGADAALYASIEDWGQKYRVISSENRVVLHLSLVDLKSGQDLWSGYASATEQNQGSSDLIGTLIDALAHSLINNNRGTELALARQATESSILNYNSGLLVGYRHPRYAEDLRGIDQPSK